MENVSENIDGLDGLGPAPVGVEAGGVPMPGTSVASGALADADGILQAAQAPARREPQTRGELDEELRREMQASFNNRISHLCKLAALVIAVVAFATIALGQDVPQFVTMGLCLSVALLAIAMLQDHYQHRQ